MREDDLKSTFEQLRAAPMPVRALTADDVIRGGEAVKQRRRTMAVVGSGVGTAVVAAVAVLALTLKPGAVPSDPVVPAGPSSGASTSRLVEAPTPAPVSQAPVEPSLSVAPSTLPTPEGRSPVPTSVHQESLVQTTAPSSSVPFVPSSTR